MERFFVLFMAVFLSFPTLAWQQRDSLSQQSCQIHAQYGMPQTHEIQTICRQGYLVGYDSAAKIPKYVTYHLDPKNALGCVARSNAFEADASIKNGATPNDYVGTGYDRGHQAPDGDMSWDTQVELESFLMTNMAPQAGSLNRGIWKLLETSIRDWAVELNKSLTIYVGAVYNSNDKKIGNGVVVPHGFYKIVIDDSTHQVVAWYFPHVAPYPNLGNDLTKYRVSIASIEQASGVMFALPKNAVELAVGKEWPVDYGALNKQKKAKCSSRN